MCRLTCHEHLPLQLSGQPQHTEHDAQHYEPPEDGAIRSYSSQPRLHPAQRKNGSRPMKAIDANCSQQACWSIAAVRTSSKRYQSRKAAQMHFPAKPGRFRREALTEASAARSTKAAAASTLLSRTARTEPGLPCPEDGAAQLCRRDAECQRLGRECLFLLHSGTPPLPDGEWAAGQRPIVAADDAVTRKDCARKIGYPHRGDGRQCGQHAQGRTHQTYRPGQTGGQRNAQSQQCCRFV